MTNQPVLRARTIKATAPVPASEADAQFDVQLRRAQAIANAKQAVPASYRQNQGAVLLAMDWAESRGVDLLTTVQTVAFIDGKPVIDATMQRALADRAGYRVTILEASPRSAAVQISDKESGEVLGSASYTIEDAERAGLAKKSNWEKNPEDMCVARATTRAMRRYAPVVMVGLVAGEDELDEIQSREDPVAVLTQNAGEEAEPQVATPPSDPPLSDGPPTSPATPVEDAEIVAEQEDDELTDLTRGRVQAAISGAREAGTWKELAQQLQVADIPLVAKQMTESDALRALVIIENQE